MSPLHSHQHTDQRHSNGQQIEKTGAVFSCLGATTNGLLCWGVLMESLFVSSVFQWIPYPVFFWGMIAGIVLMGIGWILMRYGRSCRSDSSFFSF